MRTKKTLTSTSLAVVLATGVPAFADSFTPTNVPNAQPKVVGNTAPNVVSPELSLQTLAQGSTRLEPNSDPLTKFYGYDDDGSPMLPAPLRSNGLRMACSIPAASLPNSSLMRPATPIC